MVEERIYSLTLIENGLDFVKSGVKVFFSHDTQDGKAHKDALLNLFSGLLLLLKERLRREHPAFMFAKVEDVGDELSAKKTVDYDSALVRLEKIARITFKPSERTLLRTAQGLRNRLEHGHAELNLNQTKFIIANLTEFVCMFLRDHLNVRLEDCLGAEERGRVVELEAIASRMKAEALAEWQSRAAKFEDLSEEQLAKLAEPEPYHPKHNPEPEDLLECEQCGEESVVLIEHDIALCTNADCRELHRVTPCEICGSLRALGTPFCSDCISYGQYLAEKD